VKGIRPGDRWTLAAAACLAAGAILLVVAWYDISGTNRLYEQMPYLISAGFSGMALVIVGSALLVASRYDRIERRLAKLVDAVTEPMNDGEGDSAAGPPAGQAAAGHPAGAPLPAAHPPAAATPLELAAEGLLVTPGGTTYHRPECPLVRDKPATVADPGAIASGSLTACPLCDPEPPESPELPGGARG
jgi:hypothetical protein